MDMIYQQLSKVLSSFDYTANYLNAANNPVKNLQYKLLDALKEGISSMAWEVEHKFSKCYNDSADIYGSNEQSQVIIELDTTRADQVAKKMVSRFYYSCDIPSIYVSLLYPGTEKMVVNECKKYFKYGKEILKRINKKAMFIGVILRRDGTVFILNDADCEFLDERLNSGKGNDKEETNHVSPVKKPAPKTTSISKKPATPTKTISNVKGIGQYVKALFTRLVQQGKLTQSQIAVLKDSDYCRETFGIGSFAVLVDANTMYDKSRYYKHDSQIPFVICNNWHKQNWEKLEDWMKQNIKNDLINKG